MILANQFIGTDTTATLPLALELRGDSFTSYILALVVLCFVLISFSKLQNLRVFSALSRLFLANKNVEQLLKEEMRLNSLGSVALLLNYFISTSICTFLALYYGTEAAFSTILTIAILAPFGLFLLQIIGLWLVGFITRETKIMVLPSLHSLLHREFIGLFLFFISLLWVLNPGEFYYFTIAFLSLMGLELLLWNGKSVALVLRGGVSWYYIILYLCTLEILPLFIVYYLLVENFKF